MLVNCKPKCIGKKATTTASLDVDTNEVVCDFCQETIEMSSFVKTSMKQRGDVVKKDKRKPFQFNCLTCNKLVQTFVEDDKLVGFGCEKNCSFDVSDYTVRAIKQSNPKPDDDLDE